MKVRPYRTRTVMAAVAQARTILRGFRHLSRENRRLLVLLAVVAVGLAFLLFPYDRALLAALRAWPVMQAPGTRRIAGWLGTWGDYPTYNLPLALGLWFYGVWTKSRAWRRVAIVAFLGATLAGVFDDCLRLTLGRPRPDAHLPDGFYGLPASLSARFESFPSGHAAAVCGTAAALLVTCFPWGVATALYALCVLWARMEIERHYPSDILVGSMLGTCVGLLVGLGSKVRRSSK